MLPRPADFARFVVYANWRKHHCFKGYILLRRRISLKVICEKVNFSKCDFFNGFCGYEWTCM